MKTEQTGLLPRLILDCEEIETVRSAQPAPAFSSVDLTPALTAATSSDPQDGVDKFLESIHSRYGFSDVARLFERLAQAAN